jgi:D-xylose 1-dehydrogenase (NADP+, D-xylono-1,5-lactone-forming)
MAEPLRWGVVGSTARIYTGKLRPAMERAGQIVVAEASLSADGPQAYTRLVHRDDIDAVYIPLPNHLHAEWAHAALDAGKHVLCEKPLTLSPGDTKALFVHAERVGKVILEAYMWPHHPVARTILALAAGDLGSLQSGHAVFSWPMAGTDDHRTDARGAGAMFDVGIYCVAPFLMMAERPPVAVAATAVRNASGVDVQSSGWIDWGSGFSSSFSVSFDAPPNRAMTLIGSRGVIDLPEHVPGSPSPSTLHVRRRDGSVDGIVCDGGDAYSAMVAHFTDVVAGEAVPVFGRTHSERLAQMLADLHAATASSA